MRVVDNRFTLLGAVFGDEWLALSKRERETLRRAAMILGAARERRTREYYERGIGQSLGLAEDIADESDDLLLATTANYLLEIVGWCGPAGEIVRLPWRAEQKPRRRLEAQS